MQDFCNKPPIWKEGVGRSSKFQRPPSFASASARAWRRNRGKRPSSFSCCPACSTLVRAMRCAGVSRSSTSHKLLCTAEKVQMGQGLCVRCAKSVRFIFVLHITATKTVGRFQLTLRFIRTLSLTNTTLRGTAGQMTKTYKNIWSSRTFRRCFTPLKTLSST